MPEPLTAFVDTNVFVYALRHDDLAKSSIASRLIDQLMVEKLLVTSTQVLQEIFVTVTKKAERALSPQAALRHLDHISLWPVITHDYSGIRRAAELTISDGFSLWDALIVVAASRAGAKRLYSEDLQHGRVIWGIEIINPFLT